MIKYNNKEIYEIVKSQKQIAYLRQGLVLIWTAIRSCFGEGVWHQNKKWISTDKWKNNRR